MGDSLGVFAAALLASGVEFVEAFTIVLAMGTTRGWRSSLAGAGAAVAALAVITAVAGYSITEWLPEALLQLVIGVLLLLFGLSWLRKAVLRATGLKALHDEDRTFREEREAALAAQAERRFGVDPFGFTVSFKGVFLEGVEVVFIVIGFGASGDSLGLAAAGAALGGLIVIAAGVALRRPLARVPENTIKLAVGLLLTSFGTFWAVEGLGYFSASGDSLEWPGHEAAVLPLLALWSGLAWAYSRYATRGTALSS